MLRPLRERVVDYGVVFLCLYPMATPQILDGSFQLGGTPLYVPDVGDAGHRRRRADRRRRGAVRGRSSCCGSPRRSATCGAARCWSRACCSIGLTIAIGFTLPLFPNIDVAFQGFNVWHSVQYLGLVWFLMAMRKERGEIDNRFVAEMNGPDRPWQFYGLAVLLTAVAGMLVLVLHGVFGVDLQKAYYIVILSTLLQHYYLDHLQFTKLGDMLGTGDRLLAGRAATP